MKVDLRSSLPQLLLAPLPRRTIAPVTCGLVRDARLGVFVHVLPSSAATS